MSDEGNHIHLGGSGDPVSSGDRSCGEREPRTKDGRSVMVPQFGGCHESAEVVRGQNAEVSHLCADAREHTMQKLVQLIEGSERIWLRTLTPFGKNSRGS